MLSESARLRNTDVQLEKEIAELEKRENEEAQAESLLSNWSRADQESVF